MSRPLVVRGQQMLGRKGDKGHMFDLPRPNTGSVWLFQQSWVYTTGKMEVQSGEVTGLQAQHQEGLKVSTTPNGGS